MTLLLGVAMVGCNDDDNGGGGVPPPAVCEGSSCVSLGTAGNYAIFANTGIATDAGASTITGDIGVGPGVTSTAITGFALTLPAAGAYSTSTQVSGNVYAFDYAAPTPTEVTTASTDMGTAYTAAAGKTSTAGCPGSGNMSGLTITPGVYTCAVNVTMPTDLTLNGSATDVWVFQITGTLDMDAAMNVILSGGALPQNIFWQVSDAVTIGANTHFEGIILGQTSITFGNLASIDGALLAQSAVTLDATTVTQP
jgi:hypothetical protein